MLFSVGPEQVASPKSNVKRPLCKSWLCKVLELLWFSKLSGSLGVSQSATSHSCVRSRSNWMPRMVTSQMSLDTEPHHSSFDITSDKSLRILKLNLRRMEGRATCSLDNEDYLILLSFYISFRHVTSLPHATFQILKLNH